MAEPFKGSWDSVDNDYYTRRWGLRRERQFNNMLLSGPSSATETLNLNTSSPSSSTKSSGATIYGSRKRTLDVNNARFLYGDVKNLRKSTGADIGGPFLSEMVSVSKPTHVVWSGTSDAITGSKYVIDAHVHTSADFITWASRIASGSIDISSKSSSDFKLKELGASAIADTIPSKPEMSLSTAIGELKQGIPNLIGLELARRRDLSSLGSEYLNYNFGILPTINDASDIIRLTKRYESILRQFKRDQGRVIRRRRTLAETTETIPYSYPSEKAASGTPGKSQLLLHCEKLDATRVHHERIWFSAAYGVAYPKDLDKRLKELVEFNRVYGVIPDPSTLWNLLPWSWLVDWFTNVGDIVTNVSYLSGESTRLDYGYVMCSSSTTYKESGMYGPPYVWTRAQTGSPIRLSSSLTYTRKRRIRASPFGFGVSFGDLSVFQKSILAALGISRLRV